MAKLQTITRLNDYLAALFKTAKAGDAREEGYYPDLKGLLEGWIAQHGGKQHVTMLPKKTEGGNPDFRVWDGQAKIVGYIEAKDPKVENLELIERSEQLKRYRSTFPNLILTNFFEFRLYRNGEFMKTVQVGRPFIIHRVGRIPPVENEQKFFDLLEQFFAFSIPKTTSARVLAVELAKRTRFLRDNIIAEEVREERIEGTQTLESFYQAFKDHLIATLTPKEFADLFAQTITYGLFAARSRAHDRFTRQVAYDYIPPTIGILRKVFRFISSVEVPQSLEIIDDIAEVLAEANVKKIMHDFFTEGKGRDPILHFYETFLAEYDPNLRERRGVYYTPEPVVSYITRSIHKILKERFGKEDGFASEDVTVLDPAAGTLTFPASAIQLAVEEYRTKFGEGGIQSLLKGHILRDFYAFELMMAPYAIGHLKIGFILEELGHKLTARERFNLFLTNTLDFTKEDPNRIPGVFEQEIAKESAEAMDVKEKIPIMVVMGNPPYSVSSTNIIQPGTELHKLYESYKERVRKEERNIQPLSDDYIKFIAFAHWKVLQAKRGIVGMITNNSYLDGLIHRDMRRKLLEDFNEIYILNLHGSARRPERTPDSGEDKNVFDIQQGVSIVVLVKNGGTEKKVYYKDIWGSRERKYAFLSAHDVLNTDWQQVHPSAKHYYFVSKTEVREESYGDFVSVSDIFRNKNTGIKTSLDDFVIDFSRQALEAKMRVFTDVNQPDDLIKQAYHLKDKPTSGWSVSGARKKLQTENNFNNYFKQIVYRPFDKRWIFYHSAVVLRPRFEIMNHLLQPNLALIVARQFSARKHFIAFVTDGITEISSNPYASYIIHPLYLYPEKQKKGNQSQLFKHRLASIPRKVPNIHPELIAILTKTFGEKVIVNDLFSYIYAILYSNTYRKKYLESLKIDFPRIPFTSDYKLFEKLADLGEQLVQLHLLKSTPADNRFAAQLAGRGDAMVKKVEWRSNEVWVNDEQRFTPVPEEAWNYYIGGYQVLHKWLKDRKGRALTAEEIKTYCRIVAAILATMEIQEKIDRLYPKVEKELIEWQPSTKIAHV